MSKVINPVKSIAGNMYHIFGAFAFVLLPFVTLNSTQDPELMPRMILLSVFTFFAAIFMLFKKQVFNLTLPVKRIFLIIIAMLLWAGFNLIYSINTGDALTEWVRIAIFCNLFFCLYIYFQERIGARIHLISRYTMIAVYIFCTIGIIQALEGLQNRNSIGYSLSNSIWSTLANKNFFAECLILLLPFQIYGTKRETGVWKILFRIALVLSLAFVLILQSAGAWLALFIGAITFLLLAIKQNTFTIRQTLVVTVSIVLLISAGVFISRSKGSLLSLKIKSAVDYFNNPQLIESTREENNNSVFERLMLWRNSVRMIKDHPFGVGINNWKIYNPSYGIGGTQYTNSGMISYEHPHNDYLLIMAEQGAVGLIIYLLVFILVIREGLNVIRITEGNDKFLVSLIVSGVIAFMIMSFVSYPHSRAYQMLLLMLMFAIIVSCRGQTKSAEIKVRPIAIWIFAVSTAGIIIFTERTVAEIHTRNAIFAQVNSNFPRLKREAAKANTWLHPLDQSSTPLSWYEGMACYYTGDIHGALMQYENAVKVNFNHLRLLNDLASCYEKEGRRVEAIHYYKKALAISPQFIEGNLNITAAYFNSGNIDSAVYYFDKISGLKMSMFETDTYLKYLKVINKKRGIVPN